MKRTQNSCKQTSSDLGLAAELKTKQASLSLGKCSALSLPYCSKTKPPKRLCNSMLTLCSLQRPMPRDETVCWHWWVPQLLPYYRLVWVWKQLLWRACPHLLFSYLDATYSICSVSRANIWHPSFGFPSDSRVLVMVSLRFSFPFTLFTFLCPFPKHPYLLLNIPSPSSVKIHTPFFSLGTSLHTQAQPLF